MAAGSRWWCHANKNKTRASTASDESHSAFWRDAKTSQSEAGSPREELSRPSLFEWKTKGRILSLYLLGPHWDLLWTSSIEADRLTNTHK